MVAACAPFRKLLTCPGGAGRWVVVALGALIVSFPGGNDTVQAYAHTDTDKRIEVEVRNGLVSLDVRNAPLADVIREIGEVAGFETVVQGSLDTQITRSFTEIPVYDAVRRLARETIFVIIHAPDASGAEAASINEIRLYRSTLGQPPLPRVITVPEGVDPELLAGLSADDVRERVRAVQKLGRTGEESALALFERVIRQDDDPMVRGQAAAALGRFGSERAIPALQAALDDPEQSVRVQAVRALGHVGGESSARILGELLLNDADGRVRRTAAWSLGQVDDELARSYLKAASRDPDSAVRQTASQSLGRWEEAAEEGL